LSRRTRAAFLLRAPCPCLPRELQSPGPRGGGAVYKTILVGTDGSPTAEIALARAIALAKLTGATLHVATINESEPTLSSPWEQSSAPSSRPDFQADVALEAALERQGGGDLDTRQHVRTGEPQREIVAIAREEGADVIVLGSVGMRGAGRLLGSVPNSVSHRAPCDVVIVKTT
jgi:nucleotide-binding universal stress UspA family protein